MTSYNPVIKNGVGGAIFYVCLPSMATSGVMQTNPTLAVGDVKISLDGAAQANLTTLPVVTPAGGKQVKVTLNQAETNADNLDIVFSDQTATKEWADTFISIQTAGNTVNLDFTVPAIGRGTVTSGASATSVPTSAFTPSGASLDQFAGRVVLFDANTTTPALRGCARAISSSSNAAAPVFTVTSLPAVPVSGDLFSVV
jgi:hypothetical protein